MVHGLPNYFTSNPVFDLGDLPQDVLDFFAALDALPEPTNHAPLPYGTQDSIPGPDALIP